MKPKKQDRFERMVRKKAFCTPGSKVAYYLDPFDAIALLRKEHKAVVRMVKEYARRCVPPGNERCVEVWEDVPIIEKTCQDILDHLTRRAR